MNIPSVGDMGLWSKMRNWFSGPDTGSTIKGRQVAARMFFYLTLLKTNGIFHIIVSKYDQEKPQSHTVH